VQLLAQFFRIIFSSGFSVDCCNNKSGVGVWFYNPRTDFVHDSKEIVVISYTQGAKAINLQPTKSIERDDSLRCFL